MRSENRLTSFAEVKAGRDVLSSEFECKTVSVGRPDLVGRVGSKIGRTVSLRRFEFARIDLSMTADSGPDVLEELDRIVMLLVDGEVAVIKRSATEIPKWRAEKPLKDVQIELSYGMTLDLGNYESVRFDVTMSGYSANSDDLPEVFSRLSSELGKEVGDRYKRFRG